MQRHDFCQQLQLPVQQPLLFGLAPMFPFVAEFGQVLVLLERQRMNPGEVRPALQIDNVALCKALGGPRGRIDRQAPLLVQLQIAAVGTNHMVRVNHEKVVEQVHHVGFGQPVGRQPGDPQVIVLRAAARCTP